MTDYKYVKKLDSKQPFAFWLYLTVFLSGIACLLGVDLVILFGTTVSNFSVVVLLILGTFNTLNGVVGINRSATIKRKRVELTETEKLLDD